MDKHVKKFAYLVSILCSTVLLGVILMMSGCGGGDHPSPTPATQSATTDLSSANTTLNANGTVTTTAVATAKTASGNVALTIPANITITGKDSNGNIVKFTSLPSIVISTPTSGVSGMPNPITKGYSIASTAGALEITIGDMNTVTFSSPVTVSILVDLSKVTSNTIYMNENDGKGWLNMGKATISGNVATFTTTSFCWYGIDNFYSNGTTGSSGSSSGGGTGSGF